MTAPQALLLAHVFAKGGLCWRRWPAVLACGLLLAGCARERPPNTRLFPHAQQAFEHWRSHESEFRGMAAEWDRVSGRSFYPGPTSWWWNRTGARKVWWGLGPWRVRQLWNGREIPPQEDYWSFDEAARVAGIRASALTSLMQHAANLQVRSVEEVTTPAGRKCARFNLEGTIARPNGFLRCPGTAGDLHVEDVHGQWLNPAWVREPADEYTVIDADWAYFEMPAPPPD